MILMRKVISIRTQPSVLGVLWNPLPHGLSGACVELHKAREERGPEGQGGRFLLQYDFIFLPKGGIFLNGFIHKTCIFFFLIQRFRPIIVNRHLLGFTIVDRDSSTGDIKFLKLFRGRNG